MLNAVVLLHCPGHNVSACRVRSDRPWSTRSGHTHTLLQRDRIEQLDPHAVPLSWVECPRGRRARANCVGRSPCYARESGLVHGPGAGSGRVGRRGGAGQVAERPGQDSQVSCSAACAAKLLVEHGIEASEPEMILLCLTNRLGTPPLGLYGALKIKTRGTLWNVEIVRCGFAEFRQDLLAP